MSNVAQSNPETNNCKSVDDLEAERIEHHEEMVAELLLALAAMRPFTYFSDQKASFEEKAQAGIKMREHVLNAIDRAAQVWDLSHAIERKMVKGIH